MLAALQIRLQQTAARWLFQLRDAESGEVFLNQRRVFIVPTKAGWGFVAMLAVLFIASINYNLSLGLGLTFLIGGCALIDMHLTFRNLAYLSLAAGRARPVFCGEEAHFELHLLNRRKHDRYAIWIGFIDNGVPDVEHAVDIQAESTRAVKLAAPTMERGRLSIPRIRLQTRFPLGLLRAWSYWKPDATVMVYPKPEENAPPLPVSHQANADGESQAGEEEFAGIRAYQQGDSLRRLAWRQIARLNDEAGDNLIAKHFEGGASGSLMLDMHSLPASLDLEMKLSRLTRWVIEAEARGIPYAFRLGNTVLAAGLGPLHQEACLRALALYGKHE